jgi:hypothetical protein
MHALSIENKRQWDNWSAQCSDTEYVTIANPEIENGKALCDRYSQSGTLHSTPGLAARICALISDRQ